MPTQELQGKKKKKKKVQGCLAKEPGSTFAAMQRNPVILLHKQTCTMHISAHCYVRQINVMHVTVITFQRETLKLMKLLLCVTSTWDNVPLPVPPTLPAGGKRQNCSRWSTSTCVRFCLSLPTWCKVVLELQLRSCLCSCMIFAGIDVRCFGSLIKDS